MDANGREFKHRLIRVYTCAFVVGEISPKNKILIYSSAKIAKNAQREIVIPASGSKGDE